MSGNILDLINTKLAAMAAQVRATDEKVATERDLRAGQVSHLQSRVSALEVVNDQLTSELELRLTMHNELTGRVDALVAQLTALGVDAGI